MKALEGNWESIYDNSLLLQIMKLTHEGLVTLSSLNSLSVGEISNAGFSGSVIGIFSICVLLLQGTSMILNSLHGFHKE